MKITANLLGTSNGICLVSVWNVQFQHNDEKQSQETVLAGEKENIFAFILASLFWPLCPMHQLH